MNRADDRIGPTRSPQRERVIVARIRRVLETRGACVLKIHGGPHMRRGEPDLLGCIAGRAFALEIKVPGRDATPLQLHRLAQWERAGAAAGVVTSAVEALRMLRDAGVPLGVPLPEGTHG